MIRILNVCIRMTGCILAIHGINLILACLGMQLFVGINGITVVLAAILGLPGILGLYAVAYFL